MKIEFRNAEGVLERLTSLDNQELPIGLFAPIRKLLLEFKGEASIYFPKREKILQDLCTLEKGEDGKQFWKFPKPEDEKFPEFEQRWNEMQNVVLEFNYKPIDYLTIIENTPEEIKKRIAVKGKDFDILDILNEMYKNENSPPEANTSAGEANKGPKNPTPDA